ncbi:putative nucleotide-diphospho-sugar transferase [Hoeflea marina]|nr:putative nucleotide-diphospho-sugar transferase [Hoeflea marina]
MKIYSCYTPSHEMLYREYFLPSLPVQFEDHSTRFEIVGSGDFGAPDFLRSIEAKIGLVLDSIAANAGQAIIWSDVDIVYFGDPLPIIAGLLTDQDIDIWFQKEHVGGSDDVNAGLILMRCNAAVEQLFRDALAMMRSTPGLNDQDAINRLIRKQAAGKWAYLPLQFAARSQGWPPATDIVAYHANCTVGADGVGQKLRQFAELNRVRRFGATYWRMHSRISRLLAKIKARL